MALGKSGDRANYRCNARRAVTAFGRAYKFVPLAGRLTLSVLHKLNAHLEGDRLAAM